MLRGTVKWFDAKKGYGFITGPDSTDYFVHFAEIRMEGFKTLNQNDLVEFEVKQGNKGPQATDVRIIKRAWLN